MGLEQKVASTSALPRVTFGLISCNRLHYLRATLESARRCIQYPNLQWIVIDNASTEPELRDYLQSRDWIDELILREHRSPQTEHAAAMNEIIQRAQGEFVFIWPEDVQFIVEGNWLVDIIELMQRHPWIGSVGLNYLRKMTYAYSFSWRPFLDTKSVLRYIKYRGLGLARQQLVRSNRGYGLRSFGWMRPGVVGSGIPSLTRTKVWHDLGGWHAERATSGSNRLSDSSGGAENNMERRYFRSALRLQQATPIIPVAADIVNDAIGAKAKVRGHQRYGTYTPPTTGQFYYQILPQQHFDFAAQSTMPLAFEDYVQPIGFTLPLDEQGNLRKAAINKASVVDLPQ